MAANDNDVVPTEHPHDASGVATIGRCVATLRQAPRTQEDVAARIAEVRQLVRRLDGWGLDGESVVRFGMGEFFVGPIVGAVAMALVLEARNEQEPNESPLDGDGWREALNLVDRTPFGAAPSEMFGRMEHSAAYLRSWVECAPFDDLLSLAPPTRDEMSSYLARGVGSERGNFWNYRWLVERSVEPDFEHWAWQSLQLEFRWLAGKLPLVAPLTFLRERDHDEALISREIARRVVFESDQGARDSWRELMSSVHKQASSLLKQGRNLEAAALFEFLLSQRPGDAAVANNLGFCLLPVDAVRADFYFVQAQRNGYEPEAMLVYNRMCCAFGGPDMAARLLDAERYWVSGVDNGSCPGIVWHRDQENGWAARDVFDVRTELLDLAIDYCNELGRFDRLRIWEERRQLWNVPESARERPDV